MVKYGDTTYDDVPGGKKKIKKGFKSDRRENYQKMIAKKISGKNIKSNNTKNPSRVRQVTFDEASRREYLLTLHKKKNERRVQAFVELKQKSKRENAKTRQQQREEARLAYNSYAKVPILPNYTFGFDSVRPSHEAEEDHTSSDSEADACDADSTTEFSRRERKATRQAKQVVLREQSTHAMPIEMIGRRSAENSTPGLAGSSGASAVNLFKDIATVEVQPLFAEQAKTQGGSEGARRKALPSADFSDLPAVVEDELRRLRRETKGPSRTKAKVHVLKELQKIRRIKKYSRKGHGKKAASGKRKNRKK